MSPGHPQQPQPQSLLPQPLLQPQLPPQLLPQPKKRIMSMRMIQMQLLLLQNIYITFPRA